MSNATKVTVVVPARSQCRRHGVEIGHPPGAGDELPVEGQELLADRARVLGPDHPDTLTTRHNVAFWTSEAGDTGEALALLEALLPDRARFLGPDHPDTLATKAAVESLRPSPF